MAAADDGPPDRAEAPAQQASTSGSADSGPEGGGGADHGVASLEHHIDRVADKVKGLLRSER